MVTTLVSCRLVRSLSSVRSALCDVRGIVRIAVDYRLDRSYRRDPPAPTQGPHTTTSPRPLPWCMACCRLGRQGTSHFALLLAFASCSLLERALEAAERAAYLEHA